MEAAGLDPSPATKTFHFNLAIRGFGKLGQWERSLQILSDLEGAGVSPGAATFSEA